jgi:HD-GYP domain-containing protein (c-di-GMP phosphodiesterase class II)
MKQKSLGPVVDLMTRMGNEYAQLVADRETNAIELLKVLEHDYYTYTHVTNVCTYCLLLARGIGIHDAESLREIAAGALLHDVGKRAVPASILNKPGRLTSEEMRIMQRHPTSGFRELVHRDDVTFGQLMMVYQHHERLNGSGYPVQSTGDEIHLWARICAIADVFDALTCYCPYRHPMPSAEVLRLLENGAPDSYDQELVNCWSSLLKQSS